MTATETTTAYRLKGKGYEFYRYPTTETYPLNRALATLRTDESLRSRFVRDMDGVVEQLGLSGAQAQALKTLSTEAIVKVGGHGILTLTTMLAVQMSARQAGIEVAGVA